MEQKKRTRARKTQRKEDVNMLIGAILIITCIHVLFRIFLTHMIGELGNGYFSIAMTCCSFLCFTITAIPLTLSKLLAERIGKGAWKSAKKILQAASVISGAVSLVLVVFLEVFAGLVSQYALHQSMVRMVLQFMLPVFLCLTFAQLLRGYFQGFGTRVPTAVSLVVEQVILSITSLVFAYVYQKRGVKVGTFLHDVNYGPAYGASGAIIGMLVGCFISLAFLALLFIPHRKSTRRLVERDTTVRVETLVAAIKTYALALLPGALIMLLLIIGKLVDLILFQQTMHTRGLQENAAIQWGIYEGKYHVLLMLPTVVAFVGMIRIYHGTQNKMHREEISYIKEQVGYHMRLTVLAAMLFAAIYIGLAETIVDFLFTGERIMAIRMLQFGGISIIFTAISALCIGCLYSTDHIKPLLCNLVIYAVLHIALAYVFLVVVKLDIFAVIYAKVISDFVFCIINVWSIQKKLHYRQEYVETFFKPLLGAIIVGVVLTLIQLLMGDMFPGLTLLIGLVVAIPGYFFSLFALKAIHEEDLSYGPTGMKIINFAKKIRFLA